MADNETLVSWRFDMDKFSDHLCEWVPAWVYYMDLNCALLAQLDQSSGPFWLIWSLKNGTSKIIEIHCK